MELCGCMKQLLTQPLPILLLAVVGLFVLLRLALTLLRYLYVTFLRPVRNLRRRYGEWAVVTGATDGIGKAFAFQLARLGLRLVLVGRSPEKLSGTSSAIKGEYPSAHVETVVVDFAGDLAKGVEELKEKIKALDVGVLVNNAGVSYPYARYFHEVDEGLLTNLVRVNVEGITRVTQAVLPGMLERKRGAIVNMGTGAAFLIPSYPLYAVYAASKAYIDQFTRCLYVEYKDKGIDVQCQAPLCVATKMSAIRRPSFFAPSADTYVHAAIRWIGYEPRCTPYWPHSLLWALRFLLPESTFDRLMLSKNLNIRKRGLLKDARKQA